MHQKARSVALNGNEIAKELVRKSIHVTIAFVPTLAKWNLPATVALLTAGILFYVANETARVSGGKVGLVARMTAVASRPGETGFVWGPVTLGLGAMLALLYYPDPAASIAIYALAFGDGIASLAGKLLGKRRFARLGNKTPAGSLGCFLAVFVSSYLVLGRFFPSLIAAIAATVLEFIPAKDIDNLIIPLGTGFIMTLIL
jgi:phytol kinase